MTASIQEDLLSRVGFPLQVESVEVNGLRGLLLRNVQASITPESGTKILVTVPECRVDIDLVELAYGRINVDRVDLRNAHVVLVGPKTEDSAASSPGTGLSSAIAGDNPLDFLPDLPPMTFRLTGNDCAMEIQNLPKGASLEFDQWAFDVAYLPDSERLTGTAKAVLDGDPGKPLTLELTYVASDDFDITLRAEHLAAADINRFSAGPDPLLLSGTSNISLRLASYPEGQLTLHTEAAFDNAAASRQPEFLNPITGTFTALATYDLNTRALALATAKTETGQFSGELSGGISFAGGEPEFDLQLYAADLPLARILEEFAPPDFSEAGKLEVSLEAPSEFRVGLAGTWSALLLTVNARLAGGQFAFSPAASALPAVDLTLGGTTVSWSPDTGFSEATAQILAGTVTHAASGFMAQELSGSLRFDETEIAIDPLNILVTGNPFIGRLFYDLSTQQGKFDLNGTLADLENTLLAHPEKKTELAGSLSIRCKGVLADNEYQFDVALDATQTHIQHDWFLDKPAGIGATFKGVSVKLRPRDRVEILGSLDLASAQATFNVGLNWHKGKFQLEQIRARTEPFGVGLVNQIVRLPYTISGGQLLDGYLDWKRVNNVPESGMVEFGGTLTEASFLPETGELPLRVRDGTFSVLLDSSNPDARTGAITVNAAWAGLPPFGQPWFIPLRTDPELFAKFPEVPRDMTLAVDVGEITAPPWAAHDFTTRGAFDELDMTLDTFSASVETGGQIGGSYHLQKNDNVTSVNARWQDVPAAPILWHMKMPGAMEARATGAIDYRVDRDDPNTLQGKGDLHFYNGRFSADYLFERLKVFLQNDISALPPSLQFSQLDLNLGLDGDVITTDNIRLALKGITITGAGRFITNADMDYTLTAAISPETAARMPVFRDYFNVEGHRVSQNDLKLTFQVAGPTFSPSSEVVGLPSVGVTVVSGAAELGSEAFKVIDTPRQILFDLFRIGGAIVGGGG